MKRKMQITPPIGLMVKLKRYHEGKSPEKRIQASVYELLDRALNNEEVIQKLLK